MRCKGKTRRSVTPFVKNGQQFSLHLDQKYECLDMQQNEARKDSACVPSLRSSVYVGEGVRGSFSGLFETRISKDDIPRTAVGRKHREMEIARENGARAFRHLCGFRIVLGPRARRFQRPGRTRSVGILRVHRFERSGIRNGGL
jgi:hypothetical protein